MPTVHTDFTPTQATKPVSSSQCQNLCHDTVAEIDFSIWAGSPTFGLISSSGECVRIQFAQSGGLIRRPGLYSSGTPFLLSWGDRRLIYFFQPALSTVTHHVTRCKFRCKSSLAPGYHEPKSGLNCGRAIDVHLRKIMIVICLENDEN